MQIHSVSEEGVASNDATVSYAVSIQPTQLKPRGVVPNLRKAVRCPAGPERLKPDGGRFRSLPRDGRVRLLSLSGRYNPLFKVSVLNRAELLEVGPLNVRPHRTRRLNSNVPQYPFFLLLCDVLSRAGGISHN